MKLIVLARKYLQSNRSRSPIGTISVRFDLILDHVDHDVVADKSTLVHNLLCFLSERSLLCDLSSQHVTGGLRKVSRKLVELGRKCSIPDGRHSTSL